MKPGAPRGYRFATTAQWQACLFAQADRISTVGLRPHAPNVQVPIELASSGAHAATAARLGEVLWRDGSGHLYRLAKGDYTPLAQPAPRALARGTRIVANASGLWTIGIADGTVECFDEDSLSRRRVVDVCRDAGGQVIDLAGDGEHGLLALAGEGCHWHCVRVDGCGQIVERTTLPALLQPQALVSLRAGQRLVVLDNGRSGGWLRWYSRADGGEIANMFVPPLGECFDAAALGSDSRNRLLLAGTDRLTAGGRRNHIIVLDGDGTPIGDIGLPDRPTSVTGGRDGSVVATTGHGLLRYASVAVVPDTGPELRCIVITPVLRAPPTPDGRRWLRAQATADLPPGTRIEISHASTGDAARGQTWVALANDISRTQGQRVQALLEDPSTAWSTPIVAQGTVADGGNGDGDASVAAPLFDVGQEHLLVCVTLIAPPGAALPTLRSLQVGYPGRTLMERLPAIYRRTEGERGDYLRALVGVLETTTQDLDERIAAMGGRIHPATAPVPWLDFVARWLSLPWDDALNEGQKRRIVESASTLGRCRGTRTGLQALLDAVLGTTPPCYRVIDATADRGFAILSGSAGCGNRLPALLGGLPPTATELNSKAQLGCMRLPRAGAVDDGSSQIVGRLLIEVVATARERAAWSPWLQALIAAVIPATVRLELRWVVALAPRDDDRLDHGVMVEDVPDTPTLGTDAVTGQVRLHSIEARMSAIGADIGSRLP